MEVGLDYISVCLHHISLDGGGWAQINLLIQKGGSPIYFGGTNCLFWEAFIYSFTVYNLLVDAHLTSVLETSCQRPKVPNQGGEHYGITALPPGEVLMHPPAIPMTCTWRAQGQQAETAQIHKN